MAGERLNGRRPGEVDVGVARDDSGLGETPAAVLTWFPCAGGKDGKTGAVQSVQLNESF